jgi:hypothetical protein
MQEQWLTKLSSLYGIRILEKVRQQLTNPVIPNTLTFVLRTCGKSTMPVEDNTGRFHLKCALLCDDVRREVSGKELIIGVYADAVFVAFVPFPFVLTMYIRTMVPELDTYQLKFRVLGPNDSQVTPEVSASLSKPGDLGSSVTLQVAGVAFQAQAFGKYAFQWQPPNQDWETITTLDVRKGEKPPQNLMTIFGSIVS